MKIIDIAHLVYDYIRYDENDNISEHTRAISDLNLQIEEGSFVSILGHNGSGKSTLAKVLNGLNTPTEGTVLISGRDVRNEEDLWDIRKATGMVFQNPDNQIIGASVEEDVAFGPENIGIPTEKIWKRVDRALEAVNMTAYRMKSPNRLSGGQKQRVAIAGTMAMVPKCIVLDEPTAMLDPTGRQEVIRTVQSLNKHAGVTIILITHYMEETIDSDRIVVMDMGEIVMDGTPSEIFSRVTELKSYRLDVPKVTELSFALFNQGFPIDNAILRREDLVSSIVSVLRENASDTVETDACERSGDINGDLVEHSTKDDIHGKDYIIKVENLSQVYQKGTVLETYAIKDIDMAIERGSITAIIGHTGSGKSTLIQHLNGLLIGDSGKILVDFRDPIGDKDRGFIDIYEKHFPMKELRFKVGLVFQYPEYQLFELTVITDVMFGPKNQGLSEEEARERAKEALRMVGVSEDLWEKSPFDLSGGQKRRVAIAGVLAMKPEVLVLDEPTAGLDPAGRDDMFSQIKKLHDEEGMTIILVSHSMDDVANFTDYVFVLDKGLLKMEGKPRTVFRHYEELEEMGLGAPEMTYIVRDLEREGIHLRGDPDTVLEVCDEVMRLYKGV